MSRSWRPPPRQGTGWRQLREHGACQGLPGDGPPAWAMAITWSEYPGECGSQPLTPIADYFSFAPAERPSNPLREISGYVPANLVAARNVIRAQHDVSSACPASRFLAIRSGSPRSYTVTGRDRPGWPR